MATSQIFHLSSLKAEENNGRDGLQEAKFQATHGKQDITLKYVLSWKCIWVWILLQNIAIVILIKIFFSQFLKLVWYFKEK